MNNIHDSFPGVLGQEKVLRKIKVFTDIQNDSGYFMPLLICGAFGTGKNVIGKATCALLKDNDNKDNIKPAVEVNCSTVDNQTEFFNDIVDAHLMGRNVSIILDEIHIFKQCDKIIETLLTIWNTENVINSVTWQGRNYNFDLSKISFIGLTSEPNALPKTLLSRMNVVELEELKLNELAEIVGKRLKNIKVQPELLQEIATYGRKNGRECYKLGKILSHVAIQNKYDEINKDIWEQIRGQLGIRKDGIQNVEFNILKYLKENGDSTLSKLSSALQLTGTATRVHFESYLRANNYIDIIPTGRCLTVKGKRYLEENQE